MKNRIRVTMKICLVLASWGVGGLENHSIDLANTLAKTQHNVSVIVHPSMANKFSDLVHVYLIDMDSNRLNPFFLYKIWSILNKNHFDIIHAQAGKAATLIGYLKPYLSAHSKYVTTIHGSKKTIYPYKKFDHIIAVSSDIAKKFDSSDSVSVIYNGINIYNTLTVDEKIRLKKSVLHYFPLSQHLAPLFIAVGRLDKVKAYDVLIEAFKNVNANLVIVGDGIEKEKLSNLIKQFSLENRVCLLGFRSDVPALLAISDLCVISSHREGFPLVMIEALHAQKPIISTAVSGVVEWIPSKYIVPIDDVRALNHLLIESCNNLSAMNSDFLPVFEQAEKELTLSAMVNKTIQVYESLLLSPEI
jgi:glycosyltransferase involved in cell wall biosynthesis